MKQLETIKKRPPVIDVRICSKNILTFRVRFRKKGYPDQIKSIALDTYARKNVRVENDFLDEAFDGIAIAKANTEKNLKNAPSIFESHLNSFFLHPGNEWIGSKLLSLTAKVGGGATPRGGEESYKIL